MLVSLLGPGLVAGPEPAGVIADLDDLQPAQPQVHPPGAQAKQLPAAQAGPGLDDKVVPVEGAGDGEQAAELLGGVGPPPGPAEHGLGVDLALGRPDPLDRVGGDQLLIDGGLQDAVQQRPAGHHQGIAQLDL